MQVTPLGPRETLNWFEQLDRQHEILCFMITANSEHRRILEELAQNYIDADASLGNEVAFILFGGDDVNRYPETDCRDSNRMFLPGEPLRPMALHDISGRLYFGRAGPNEERAIFGHLDSHEARELATKTVSVSGEWMKLLGVKQESLPVLCAFVKGSDPAVISLGEKVDVSKVLRLFGRLADIAQRDTEKALSLAFDAEARMKRALALGREIAQLEKSFLEQMEAMCNRFKATSEERKLVAEFLARKTYSDESLDRTLADCKFAAVDGFNSNTTVKGVRNKLGKLAKARAELESCQPREDLVVSLSDALDTINNRRQETARLVRELSKQGIDAKLVDQLSPGAYEKYLRFAAQAVALLEKLGKFLELVKDAGPITHILK